MARKRLHGEGHIRKRADGRWEFRLRLGAGKGRKTICARKRSELLARIADEKAKSGGNLKAGRRKTVGDYLGDWLENVIRPTTAASTYAMYRAQVKHVTKLIGAMRLDDVDVEELDSLYQSLRRNNVGACTLKRVHSVMKQAWKAAVGKQLVQRNPFDFVTPPVYHRPEMRSLNREECGRLLDAARSSRYFALVALLLASGARFGEATALLWSDVDWERKRISVVRGHTEAGGRVEVRQTKTEMSKRPIDLDRSTMAILREHRRRMLGEGKGSGWIFIGTKGGPLSRHNFRKRFWIPLVKAAGLEGIRPHELRHTHASLLLAAGVHPKIVAERLGHSTVKITLDTYSHVIPAISREAADRVEGLLYGATAAEVAPHFDPRSVS